VTDAEIMYTHIENDVST